VREMRISRFLVIGVVLSIFSSSPALAAIDLQADLNRIVAGIRQFDANSATSSSVASMADVKQIFANNASILREIGSANAAFKRNLNSAKRMIPTRDTKDTPAFSTLMNLSKGYEVWVAYQNKNQVMAQKCINNARGSFNSFSRCSISDLPKTTQNEIIGRQRLTEAWNAWRTWQVKYGYA
jgi:hypothetical protein